FFTIGFPHSGQAFLFVFIPTSMKPTLNQTFPCYTNKNPTKINTNCPTKKSSPNDFYPIFP
ncbi:hypothetical protein, partial [Mobiluncus mulieris]|uniref:hypothetical protein n=1 Tax=Mobiluncus mulieris TaxID=2052 RepID=UPI001B8C49D4